MSKLISSSNYLHLRLPRQVYLAARKRAAGRSKINYALDLICADLGVSLEALDYQSKPRHQWADLGAGEDHADLALLVPRTLYAQVKEKLAALPYPVTVPAYVRRLIEQDTGAGA